MPAAPYFLPWRNPRRRDLGFGNEDRRALRNLVADLDLELLHHAVDGRWHIHGGLVRFQGDQRVFGFHPVAGVHQNLDDRHVLEVADVRDFHFDEVCHCLLPLNDCAAHVGQQAREIGIEARGRRAIDHAVVP
jgi:hypothetical protein